MVEQAALVVAVLSLLASIYVFVQQRIDQKKEKKLTAGREDYSVMIDLYQTWLSPEEQRCRKRLYHARDIGASFKDLDEATQDDINHALAMMNVVAILRSAHRVPIVECDQLFGGALRRLVAAAETIGYFEWRRDLTGRTPWPRLRDVARTLDRSNA